MKFVLVHGAWHGGWCWEPLARELEELGHQVLAPDLPCDDPEAGVERYAEVVGHHPDAVVVAHSLGGLVLPLIEARLHVYLCGLVPTPGRPIAESFAEMIEPDFGGTHRDERGRSYWPNVNVLAENLYRGHERRWAEWAFPQLRRQARTPSVERCPLEALPRARSAYIVATADPCIRPAWSRKAAEELLRVEPRQIEGGHFPMLDRPAELAAMLEAVRGGDRARR